jgi:Uma2 family endonuclease
MAARVTPPVAVQRRTSLVEYYKLAELGFYRDQRVELVDGIVVSMPPMGPPHASVVQRLGKLLTLHVRDRGEVRSRLPFAAGDDTEPEPDIAVVPPGAYADRHPGHAWLVVEVAETSLTYDREAKAPLYAASGVDEYWIVDLSSAVIEVYTHPVDGRYAEVRRVGAGEKLAPAAFPDVAIDVADLVRV